MTDRPVVETELAGSADDPGEDPRIQRRRLARVWFSAGSALGAMVAASWYVVARVGSAPGGDMLGHAATAEWLRTQPWWDWRGWSDWFYGGQAIGVNYPPLGLAWIRVTDPDHGQMAAVALGLLVLLPWGALRLARAVELAPNAQRGAVGAVLVLVAASGNMHWILSGFHSQYTFFGSWPAMLSSITGLFCAAWAAQCRRPIAAGGVAGLAVLLNASMVPGIAVVCAALLTSSGATLRQGIRWAVTASAAALTVSAWWLIPFLASRDRLVRWEVPLSETWRTGGAWLAVVVAVLGVTAGWAGRLGAQGARRLARAALMGLLATVAADLFGYLRPERWLEASTLVAALAVGGLVAARPDRRARLQTRPTWVLLAVAFVIVLVVVTQRLELLPLAAWLLIGAPREVWAWSGAIAWASVLLWVQFVGYLRNPVPDTLSEPTPLGAAAEQAGKRGEGLVFLDDYYNTTLGDVRFCDWGHPWSITIDTSGRIQPLFGLYRETSTTAEFISAEKLLRAGTPGFIGRAGQDWIDVWGDLDASSFDSRALAEAIGARWFAMCESNGDISVTELDSNRVSGVRIVAAHNEASWHRQSVRWWLDIAANGFVSHKPLPTLLSPTDGSDHPHGQAATRPRMSTSQDTIVIAADEPGWAWVRVPWDPWWHSHSDTPTLKGGPGHLVIWANKGETLLRWNVPVSVDVTAAVTTGMSFLIALGLALENRRRGFELNQDRHHPASEALQEFSDTVDAWWHAILKRTRGTGARWRRRPRHRGRPARQSHQISTQVHSGDA